VALVVEPDDRGVDGLGAEELVASRTGPGETG
jgi:hypothetical protein